MLCLSKKDTYDAIIIIISHNWIYLCEKGCENADKNEFRDGRTNDCMVVVVVIVFRGAARRAPSHPPWRAVWHSPRGKYRSTNWNSVQPSFIYVWNRSLRTLFPVPFPLCSASPLRALCPRANLCVIHMSRLNDERRLFLPRAAKTSPRSRKVTDAPSIITGLTLKNIRRVSPERRNILR